LAYSGILVRKGQIVELNERPKVPNLLLFWGLLILLPSSLVFTSTCEMEIVKSLQQRRDSMRRLL
jgi:hypothetical protein